MEHGFPAPVPAERPVPNPRDPSMRSPFRAALCAAACSSLLLLAPAVLAGTAVRMELPDLAMNAALIVEARVLSARTIEGSGLLQTEYLLQVARTFAGDDQVLRTVRIPGGERADGSGLVIPGMPRIAAGEDVLLFLSEESKAGARMPVGLAQGKFEVVVLANGAKRLVGDASGMNLVPPGGGEAQHGGRSMVDYAEAVARIEAALAKKRSQR